MNLFGEDDSADAMPTGWAEFWEKYPRKVARAAALKAFRRLKPKPKVLEQMLQALAIQIPVWQRYGSKEWLVFVPHAATWLNGRRWEDEVTAKGSKAKTAEEYRRDYVKQMGEFRAKHGVPEDELAKSARLLKEWKEKRRRANGIPIQSQGAGSTGDSDEEGPSHDEAAANSQAESRAPQASQAEEEVRGAVCRDDSDAAD